MDKTKVAQDVPDGWREAVKAAASAIYFNDNSDYLPALWDALRSLSPEIAAVAETDSRRAWEMADLLAAAPQPAEQSSGVAQGDGTFIDEGTRQAQEAPWLDERANAFGECDKGCAALSRPDDTELLRELLKAIDLWELFSPVAHYEIKRLHPILRARLGVV